MTAGIALGLAIGSIVVLFWRVGPSIVNLEHDIAKAKRDLLDCKLRLNGLTKQSFKGD